MIFLQTWQGARISDKLACQWFPATVPGNIQADYGRAMGYPELQFGDNCKMYEALEDDGWLYRTEVSCQREANARVFFVTKGIEYEYDIRMNGKTLAHHEGMFSSLEVDITEELAHGNELEVYIYPHPKREGADPCRDQADQSCKAAMEYNWDWAPRLLISGLWNDTYIETRKPGHLTDCEICYELDRDLGSVWIMPQIQGGEAVLELYDPDGKLVHRGNGEAFRLDAPQLWWCVGHGKQALYTWKAIGSVNTLEGKVGFRRVKLVMNSGAWVFRQPAVWHVPLLTLRTVDVPRLHLCSIV